MHQRTDDRSRGTMLHAHSALPKAARISTTRLRLPNAMATSVDLRMAFIGDVPEEVRRSYAGVAYSGDVGIDLRAIRDTVIGPRETASIPTGVALGVPPGYYGRIAPRSGLALRHGIDVLAGVVDPGYRGEIVVILANHSDDPVRITTNMRVAQILLVRCATPVLTIVDRLESTERGARGFGSSGTH
jgi:dUTP pyrophosphatase